MEIDEYHSVIVQVTMKIQWNSNQDKCTDFLKKLMSTANILSLLKLK